MAQALTIQTFSRNKFILGRRQETQSRLGVGLGHVTFPALDLGTYQNNFDGEAGPSFVKTQQQRQPNTTPLESTYSESRQASLPIPQLEIH